MGRKANCRGCGRVLRLSLDGYRAYVETSYSEAKQCHYGGFVCSRQCDWNACVSMESSMPGAGPATRPGSGSMNQIRRNWDVE